MSISHVAIFVYMATQHKVVWKFGRILWKKLTFFVASYKNIEKGLKYIWNQRKNRSYLNGIFIKIRLNTEKGVGILKRYAVSWFPGKATSYYLHETTTCTKKKKKKRKKEEKKKNKHEKEKKCMFRGCNNVNIIIFVMKTFYGNYLLSAHNDSDLFLLTRPSL